MANSFKPAVVVLLFALLIMFIVQAKIAEGAGSGFGSGSSGSNSGGSGFGSGSSGSSNGGSSSSGGNSGFGSGSSSGGNNGFGSGSSSGGNNGFGGGSSSGGNNGFGGGSSSGGNNGFGGGSGSSGSGSSGSGHSGSGSPGSGSPGSGHSGSPGSPGCNYRGGVCGDPRIVGGDGVMFYFHGFKDQDFCIVSDSDLHINAHFIGTRPAGRPRDYTWVQALGFVTAGGHKLSIAAKRVSKWNNKLDHLLFAYNGAPFSIAEAYGSSWQSPDNVVTVERVALKNSVSVRVKEKMEVALTVVPIGKLENKVHNYGINTDENCFAHFDMQFTIHNLSSTVHGVLGQTYQPGYVNPVKRGVAMPIMGGADRFFSPSLLSTQCRMSQYTATPIAPGSALPGFRAICESSGLHSGVPGGITCRR